jgi:hypothetical protein
MRMLSVLPIVASADKTKHHRGLPPELTQANDTRQAMSGARCLVIEENQDGVFLYRFDEEGDCVGDTWHLSVDDAMKQASCEYRGLPHKWAEVPAAVEDVAAFALDKIGSEKSK